MTPLETYLRAVRLIRSSGAGVDETSYYGALAELLNAVGKTFKPNVRCIMNLQDRGAGQPDGGLFSADQFPQASPPASLAGQLPARGVIEAKGTAQDVRRIAESEQVTRYLRRYGQVLVTNLRDFLLLGQDERGEPLRLETYSLAASEDEFWSAPARRLVEAHAERLSDYLVRVMRHAAPLSTPQDVAWFLASYAREARARLEQSELPALDNVRAALEEALGIQFQGRKGAHFFRSTLVQTLFYGVFAAWVLWSKQQQPGDRSARFDWWTSARYLHVPVLRKLYYELADPGQLQSLQLAETLEWAGMVLSRVDRAAFFERFEAAHAVQYFYEPFLQAFDPELRKDLGVWYTPPEIVQYMVARVDAVLRQELGVADGLADRSVYVLDPCCGTGAYLVEVLQRIAGTLRERGENGLLAQELKDAATQRVFGFEILPAPFVVAHLQLSLLLQNLGAPFDETQSERAGVFLTNALTGWQPGEGPKQYRFHEMEEEREAAERVKQREPILVVLGNPPYNAFAGVSPSEEQGLVEPYKEGLISEWGIKKFNLDDLYVRFFRLAEHRIADMTKRGIVCFISNFSYLSDPSFVVMRQRFLREFDAMWFDCMNGDSRETGKLTPEGMPDPSVFSTEYNREGIRVGTAIGLMVRRTRRAEQPAVRFRQFWGVSKRVDLLESLKAKDVDAQYVVARADKSNRFSFRPSAATPTYLAWPTVLDLGKAYPLNGPIERRGNSLIVFESDRDSLTLLQSYLDPAVSDAHVREISPRFMQSSGEFKAEETRSRLKGKVTYDPARVTRYPFKPFDLRLGYLDSAIQPLFSRPSPDLLALRDVPEMWFFITRDTADKSPEGPPFLFSRLVCDYDCMSGHARHFPVRVLSKALGSRTGAAGQSSFLADGETGVKPIANLSKSACEYLSALSFPNLDDSEMAGLIWMHALAIGYSPAYLCENADGIRQDWPRIPLPEGRERLLSSAELGRQVAALLDTESPLPGVTAGAPRAELRPLAVAAHTLGQPLHPEEGALELRGGWGHAGKGGVTMPGKGRWVQREYSAAERAAIAEGAQALGLTLEQALQHLGQSTCDVYLNDVALWRNVPLRVWEYTIGGYQVIKKWLSYRELGLLGRSLTPDEVREVTHMARRIAALVLLEPALDANYAEVKEKTYRWGD